MSPDPSPSPSQYCDADPRVLAMSARIKPVAAAMTLAGPAFTIRCPAGDNYAIHRAIAVAPAGSVLVVSAVGEGEYGAFGEILTLNCLRRGLAGLVIDGGVRDPAEIEALGFPVFSREIAPAGTVKRDEGMLGQTISCGGAAVSPGDWIIGSREGVAVVPGALSKEIEPKVRRVREREAEMKARILAGENSLDLFRTDRPI